MATPKSAPDSSSIDRQRVGNLLNSMDPTFFRQTPKNVGFRKQVDEDLYDVGPQLPLPGLHTISPIVARSQAQHKLEVERKAGFGISEHRQGDSMPTRPKKEANLRSPSPEIKSSIATPVKSHTYPTTKPKPESPSKPLTTKPNDAPVGNKASLDDNAIPIGLSTPLKRRNKHTTVGVQSPNVTKATTMTHLEENAVSSVTQPVIPKPVSSTKPRLFVGKPAAAAPKPDLDRFDLRENVIASRMKTLSTNRTANTNTLPTLRKTVSNPPLVKPKPSQDPAPAQSMVPLPPTAQSKHMLGGTDSKPVEQLQRDLAAKLHIGEPSPQQQPPFPQTFSKEPSTISSSQLHHLTKGRAKGPKRKSRLSNQEPQINVKTPPMRFPKPVPSKPSPQLIESKQRGRLAASNSYPKLMDMLRTLSPTKSKNALMTSDLSACMFQPRREVPRLDSVPVYTQSWRIEAGGRESVATEEQHKLFSQDSQIILYVFVDDSGAEKSITFLWTGKNSRQEAGRTKLHNLIAKEHNSTKVSCQIMHISLILQSIIRQGYETAMLIRALGGIIEIYAGSRGQINKDREFLVMLRQNSNGLIFDEVPLQVASLCSRHSKSLTILLNVLRF